MDKQIYMIFYDRGYRAQDNAEHLCRWVMQNRPDIKTAYILNSSSYDWPKLVEEGFNLLDGLDKELVHNELLKCDYACSSIFNEGIKLDFSNCTCKRVFLNHGCFLVPITYLKNEHKNIDLFIAANMIEFDNMLDSYHELTEDQVALCGQPRQDELIRLQSQEHIEDSILIQFWQRPPAWAKENNKKFLASDFFKRTSELLTNEKLLNTCRENDLKIIFKMHSIQYDWLEYYKQFENDVVRLSPLSEPFENTFIQSKLIITDISSNAYEMAKIGKPCVYFIPDTKDLFTWRWKRNGGFEFDVDNDGIGPVIHDDVNEAVNEICYTIENDFVLDRLYNNRRSKQISFINDANSCQRCLNAILAISRSRMAEKLAEPVMQQQEIKKVITTVPAKKPAAQKQNKKDNNNNNYYLYF